MRFCSLRSTPSSKWGSCSSAAALSPDLPTCAAFLAARGTAWGRQGGQGVEGVSSSKLVWRVVCVGGAATAAAGPRVGWLSGWRQEQRPARPVQWQCCHAGRPPLSHLQTASPGRSPHLHHALHHFDAAHGGRQPAEAGLRRGRRREGGRVERSAALAAGSSASASAGTALHSAHSALARHVL